jgi:AcrR family transcriptional regulator
MTGDRASADGEIERSDTRSAILRAASLLLAEGGVSAVTTRAVAEASAVQPPTLYRLFGDKDGLLDAMAEHVLEEHTAIKVARDSAVAEGVDPLDDLRESWLAHVAFGLAHPELYMLLLARGRSAPSRATLDGIEVFRAKVVRLALTGRLRVDVERAVSILHAAGIGATVALIEDGAQGHASDLASAMFDAAAGAILDEARAGSSQDALMIAFSAMVPHLTGLTDGERALLGEWASRWGAPSGSE